MKKGIFWKVIVSLLVLWLFLFLWANQWHYYQPERGILVKTSKITGKTYWTLTGEGEWRKLPIRKVEE